MRKRKGWGREGKAGDHTHGDPHIPTADLVTLAMARYIMHFRLCSVDDVTFAIT